MADRLGSLPDHLPAWLRPHVVGAVAGLAGVTAAGVAIGVAAHRSALGGTAAGSAAAGSAAVGGTGVDSTGVGGTGVDGTAVGGPVGLPPGTRGWPGAPAEVPSPEVVASMGETVLVTTADGVTLHVEIDDPPPGSPARPTVVLVHGYTLDCRVWFRQRADLSRHTRVVSFDQRGHGRSAAAPAGAWTLANLAEDLRAVLDQVVGDSPVVLVGHSMGGMTILALAVAHPELFGPRVRGVGLLCTSAGVPADLLLPGSVGGFGPLSVMSTAAAALNRSASRGSQYTTGALLTLAAGLPTLTSRTRGALRGLETALTRAYSFAIPVSPALVRFVGSIITSTPVPAVAALYPSIVQADLWAGLAALQDLPVLVVTADHDRLMPAAHGRAMAARLRRARLVELAPAGHLAFLEYPELIDADLDDLLDLATPAPAPTVDPAAGAGPA